MKKRTVGATLGKILLTQAGPSSAKAHQKSFFV